MLAKPSDVTDGAKAAPLPAPAHFLHRPRLFIDVQHGLCNRLRALASAAVIARATERALVLIWRPDHHCGARIGDLLRYPGPVIEDAAADGLRARSARVYNYMEIEPGARLDEPVLPLGAQPRGDVYVRSAAPLVSPYRDGKQERRFLRELVLTDAVAALVARGRPGCDVAVHVRMATGEAFDHLPHEAPSNWPAHRHAEIVAWRRASHAERFIKRLDDLVAAGGIGTIFLAADLPETYERFAAHYGQRLFRLPRQHYDRSVPQVQHALADLALLTSGRRLLASTWSTFSDMAVMLAGPHRPMERSGIDF